MRRQALRSALILVSMLLMPVTLFYLSPALIIMGAAAGIMSGSFIVFCAQLIAALALGRAFCGWVCPGAGLQEACFAVSARPARGGKGNWVKYFIWVPWLVVIAVFASRAGGLHGVDFFFKMNHGAALGEPHTYIIFYFVVTLIVALALTTGRRGFCHYACWMAPFMVLGTALRNALRLPGLRLAAQADKCTQCGRCSHECPMSLDVKGMVQTATMDNLECVLCGKCVDKCPREVISYTAKPPS